MVHSLSSSSSSSSSSCVFVELQVTRVQASMQTKPCNTSLALTVHSLVIIIIIIINIMCVCGAQGRHWWSCRWHVYRPACRRSQATPPWPSLCTVLSSSSSSSTSCVFVVHREGTGGAAGDTCTGQHAEEARQRLPGPHCAQSPGGGRPAELRPGLRAARRLSSQPPVSVAVACGRVQVELLWSVSPRETCLGSGLTTWV